MSNLHTVSIAVNLTNNDMDSIERVETILDPHFTQTPHNVLARVARIAIEAYLAGVNSTVDTLDAITASRKE